MAAPSPSGPSPSRDRREWVCPEWSDAVLQPLRDAGFSRTRATLLASRGPLTPDAVRAFLSPRLQASCDPSQLPDLDKAVARLSTALQQGELILVFGDFDVDGVSSTALMTRVLRALGGEVQPFLPCRFSDGYGFSVSALTRALAEGSPKVIVTVDCGTTSVEAVAKARALGIDVIITDHHEISDPVAPALAVCNPKCTPAAELQELAGVGVAFKLCHGLVRALRQTEPERANIDLRHWLGLVALGTVADIAPLQGENRILTRHGLQQLNRAPSAGLKALREVAGIRGALDTYHIGFMLGPRLNAAGRMGSATTALQLLLSDDADEAQGLAAQLDAANTERRAVEARIVEEAMAQVDAHFEGREPHGVVAAGAGWHVGTIGIVASRLVARYRVPAVVIGLDEAGKGRGSARSAESIDLLTALTECEEHLLGFGGHQMAAGLDLEARDWEAFRDAFESACARAGSDPTRPRREEVDVWLESLGEADEDLMAFIDDLSPFGEGNRSPVFAVAGVWVDGEARRVGGDQRHLKAAFRQGHKVMDAIGFGLGERDLPTGEVDLLFALDRNEFRGRTTLQLKLKDWRPAAG